MDQGGLTELEYETEQARIRFSRRQETAPAMWMSGLPAAHAAAAAAAPAPPAAEEGLVTFAAPMVGTFYRAPSPEAGPYVSLGDRVEPESVLCILEAMKVMNEIKAECRGEVAAILVENGEPVEFGQPLFKIRP